MDYDVTDDLVMTIARLLSASRGEGWSPARITPMGARRDHYTITRDDGAHIVIMLTPASFTVHGGFSEFERGWLQLVTRSEYTFPIEYGAERIADDIDKRVLPGYLQHRAFLSRDLAADVTETTDA